ncbi:MAG: alpha/beta hydrolase [Proteobacteria bacterium]|nr:alpha/beta hydrolase [Pseudomonadota bacterium]MBU1583275.1 alpha/beta hydrolase [Pseudomonadota bacterium]MBU2452599.1 alpha/beta hydrolase [Pseudomonadota bacterium]MBU2632070.1 alpha/beta hydrolase [Pseudomonadota bacterium]
MENRTYDIEFISQGFLLKGILHLPQVKQPPLVIGSHGLEGSKESAKQKVLSTLLVKNDIAFFRFDHRGCGESQGNFIKDTSLEKRTVDFISAVTRILSLGKTSKNLAVFGSSIGGATCMNAWESLLKMDVNLCGAVLCSAPAKSRTIEKIPTDANEKRPALPLSFFKENLLFNITEKAQTLSNILIFHGDADEVVPVSNAHDIYALAKDPKRLIIQKNGDHQMTSKKDQLQFEIETAAWFLNCFGQKKKMAP